jgi:hypothetical protein
MDLVTPVADLRQGVLEGILHPNVDLVSKVSTPPELLLFASSSTSSTSLTINPQECQQLRSTQPTHAIDAWQFGCFLYTLFTPSHILTHRADLKNFQVLPKTLHEQYMRLISASPQNRLTLDALITTSTYFVNPLCEACQFLETLQLKENYEKENFWRKLPHLLKDIPTTYAKHKILPHLIQAMEFGSGLVLLLVLSASRSSSLPLFLFHRLECGTHILTLTLCGVVSMVCFRSFPLSSSYSACSYSIASVNNRPTVK